MVRRIGSVAARLLVLALAIVSTTFVFLTLTSKNWSRQDYFGGDPISFSKTWCSSHRSPFYRCGQVINDITIDPDACHIPDCKFYKPYGVGKTSCETVAADATQIATRADECQAVHYSANLQIAACAFITLGLVATVAMTLLSLFSGAGSHTSGQDAGIARVDADTAKEARNTTSVTADGGTLQSSSSHIKNSAQLFITTVLLFSMYVGVLMQILSQYFGVQGLVVLATPTQSDISGTGQNLASATWVIDKGLSTYATIAWTSALTTAALAGIVFKTPNFRQFVS